MTTSAGARAARISRFRLGLALVVALGTTSCDALNSTPERVPQNVIFILLDTLRADRLGVYGGRMGLTPEIDGFAREAVVFDRAYSHAPWTLPSVASIFTSQVPKEHGAGGRLGKFAVLGQDAVTIAEVFRRNGLQTAAIANVLFLDSKFGAMQGFDRIDSLTPHNNQLTRVAEDTTTAALEWLDAHAERPFFLFVHYFDPHLTYDPPQPFRGRFADPEDAQGRPHVFGTAGEMVAFRRGKIRLDRSIVERLEKLYNGDVAYLDQAVGRLLREIEARNLDRNSVIVLTADHGEEFADHGGFEHGHTLYDELLHVPLMIRTPGIPGDSISGAERGAGRRVATLVRQIDLAPTLCELLGLEPDAAFTGASLFGLLEGRAEADRPVFAYGNMWGESSTVWRQGRFKLVTTGSLETARLFDLESDPGEQRDLAAERPELVDRLQRELDLVTAGMKHTGGVPRTPDLSESQREQLRALGYSR